MNNRSGENPSGVLYQVSLLQGLTYGDYDGSVTLGEVKRHGDTGLGTFDRLNGELILLDGRIYRAAGDGSVEAVSDDETTPFCAAAFMKADEVKSLREIPDRDALCSKLDAMVEARGKNRFYMIRMDGVFREICVRSVYAQQAPYRRLVDVLAQEQTLFEYENIEGTLVGLYCPPYMSALNAAGWHLHFLSADKTRGGHMLDVRIADAVLTWSDINVFELRLPESDRFAGFDLTVDQSADIEKVEKNK